MSCWRMIAEKGSRRTSVPVGPKARMSKVAWRGFVRVMRPRIMSPTEGRAAVYEVDVLEEDATLMAGVAFFEGAEEVTGPARLAWMVEAKT